MTNDFEHGRIRKVTVGEVHVESTELNFVKHRGSSSMTLQAFQIHGFLVLNVHTFSKNHIYMELDSLCA